MKKKPVFWVIVAVVALVVVAVGIWGKQYYDDRYVGTDYYAVVPLDYNVTPGPRPSMDGRADMGPAVEYDLVAYNDKGEAKTVNFSVYSPESDYYRGEPMPQPGEYLRVSASKQLVVGWRIVDVGDVPAGVLELLEVGSG
ncbi:MAG: YxeA family protein [Coriobacteriia bacterium]|nr:YxeA family protein [Coriobacteriia bacterium]